MEKSDESRTRRDEQRRKYSKMDERAMISWLGHLERIEEDRMPKRSSLKNWKGREEGETPGKDGKRK
jgi:hypothetical protein